MTKGEIKSLQGLALAGGGSLSINPDTGLVEASFLKRMLPTIAGIGLNMMFPGSGALIGAGIGAFETARTGDIGKGLMAGLGAYGGANIAQGLSTAATAGTTADAANLANYAQAGGDTTAGMVAATPAPTFTQNAANTFQGLKDVTGSGQAAMNFGKQNLMNIGAAAAPMVAGAMTPETGPIPGAPEEEERYKGSPYRYNLASNFTGSTPTRPNPYYRPTGLGYAEGGDIMMAGGGSFDDEPMGDDTAMAAGGIAAYAAGGGLKMKTMSLGEGIAKDTDEDTASLGAYDAAMKRMEKQYGAANLKPTAMPKSRVSRLGEIKTGIAAAGGGSIGGYSDGGRMLKGPGDGMSDSIPATINRKQPARLADGEFVVPADVVSHLGNGSTDAGAKRLYSMMDKVRKARTGKKKQAPAVKAERYMPA
jgi:hypothetical protein